MKQQINWPAFWASYDLKIQANQGRMATDRTKDYKGTFKSPDLLLPAIRRHVMKKSMEPDDRRMDILHPSEMSKLTWCPRHDYYRIVGQYPANTSAMNSFRSESIFDYGHSVHRKWQGWLNELGILWGKWECLNDNCGVEFYGESPDHCELCGSTALRYREVPIIDNAYLLEGHADGAIIKEKAIVEIKSIGLGTIRIEAPQLHQQFVDEQLSNDELWFRIHRPFSTHIRQAMLYLHFMRQRYGENNWDKLIFIYEWKANQDAKEFVVKYNKALIANTLVAMESVARAKDEGIPPERPAWASPSHRTCRDCPVKSTCYERHSGPNQEDQSSTISVRRTTTARRKRALSK